MVDDGAAGGVAAAGWKGAVKIRVQGDVEVGVTERGGDVTSDGVVGNAKVDEGLEQIRESARECVIFTIEALQGGRKVGELSFELIA